MLLTFVNDVVGADDGRSYHLTSGLVTTEESKFWWGNVVVDSGVASYRDVHHSVAANDGGVVGVDKVRDVHRRKTPGCGEGCSCCCCIAVAYHCSAAFVDGSAHCSPDMTSRRGTEVDLR